MIVKLTQQQRDSLVGVPVTGQTFFNLDLKDINDNYVVHETEINQCSVQWLKDLTLEVYEPKEDVI